MCSSRSGGSDSISCLSFSGWPAGARLLVRRDVIDRLTDSLDLLGVLVRDLDPELVLELHDQLDEVERVRVEVLLERRLFGDLILFDAELFRQDALDLLQDLFTGRCHGTSIVGGSKSARSYTHALREPLRKALHDTVLGTARGQPDRVR